MDLVVVPDPQFANSLLYRRPLGLFNTISICNIKQVNGYQWCARVSSSVDTLTPNDRVANHATQHTTQTLANDPNGSKRKQQRVRKERPRIKPW